MEKGTRKGYQVMLKARDKAIIDVNLDLAQCYEFGIEVEKQSPTKDFELTQETHEVEALWGSRNLAIYYEKGFGVEQNLVTAARFHCTTSMKRGHEAKVAQSHYGYCLIRGRDVEEDVVRGFFFEMM